VHPQLIADIGTREPTIIGCVVIAKYYVNLLAILALDEQVRHRRAIGNELVHFVSATEWLAHGNVILPELEGHPEMRWCIFHQDPDSRVSEQ